MDAAIHQADAQLASEARRFVLDYVYSFYECVCPRREGNERTAWFVRESGVSLKGGPIRTIRITGTNGKGSTATYVEQMLRVAGMRTLCLVSPHVYSVRERIRLDGHAITWEALDNVIKDIAPILERMRHTVWQPRPTDIWAWATIWIHAKNVSEMCAIYEVGRGGRTDVTRFRAPSVVGLTNIGTDHLELFGGTRPLLLQEKLGLCAEGDILCYCQSDPDIERTVTSYCAKRDIMSTKVEAHGLNANRALAEALVSAAGVHIGPPAPSLVNLAARFQERSVLNRRFVLDGAHNREAIDCLVHALDTRGRTSRVVLFAAQRTKDWRSMISSLASMSTAPFFAFTETCNGQPESAVEMSRFAQELALSSAAFINVRTALEYLLGTQWDECVLTGTFFLFRDFELALHGMGYSDIAVPMSDIDPWQKWMRTPL